MSYSDEELVEIASSKTNPASELAHDLLEFRRGVRRAQTTSHPPPHAAAVAKGTNQDAAARLAAELRNVVLPIQKAAENLGLRLTKRGWSASEWAAELRRRRGADPEEEWENCIVSGIERLLELARALAEVANTSATIPAADETSDAASNRDEPAVRVDDRGCLVSFGRLQTEAVSLACARDVVVRQLATTGNRSPIAGRCSQCGVLPAVGFIAGLMPPRRLCAVCDNGPSEREAWCDPKLAELDGDGARSSAIDQYAQDIVKRAPGISVPRVAGMVSALAALRSTVGKVVDRAERAELALVTGPKYAPTPLEEQAQTLRKECERMEEELAKYTSPNSPGIVLLKRENDKLRGSVADLRKEIEWLCAGETGFVPFATASEEDDTLDQLWGVDDATKGQLSWRVVANAAFRGPPALRWVHVAAATGYGRSVASAMCRAEGFDPDEIVGTPDGKQVPNAQRGLKRENDELRRSVEDLRKEIAWLRESPTPSAETPAEATVPAGVHEAGWQWRPTGEDTAFAPPFGTIRACRHCGCLVAGGLNVCARCDAALHAPPVQGIDRT